MARRILLLSIMIMAAVSLVAGPASAAHDANNQFDMAATTAGLPDADATGFSNLSAGNDRWNNQIRVTDLEPFTTYEWHGVGGGNDVVICTLVTDGTGSGTCRGTEDSFLGSTDLRDAETGVVVARAVASSDSDNTVDDGEIERRGTQRSR